MRRLSVFLCVVFCLALVACGGSENAEPPAESGGAIIGQPVEVAGAAAEAQGTTWRVIREDGEDFAVTADYSAERLNFVVEGGVVISAETDAELAGG